MRASNVSSIVSLMFGALLLASSCATSATSITQKNTEPRVNTGEKTESENAAKVREELVVAFSGPIRS
jgi:hypothetical protein